MEASAIRQIFISLWWQTRTWIAEVYIYACGPCFIVQHRKCPWTNVRRHRKVYFCHHRWRGQRRRCSELETLLLRSERRIFKPPSDSGPGAAMPPPPGQAGQRHIQHEGPEVRGERKGKISHQRCRPHFGHDGWQPGLGSWIRSPKVKLQNWLQRACCLFSANPSSSVEFSGHHSAKFPDRWSKISSSRWISKAFLVLTYVSFEVVRKYKETLASLRWFFFEVDTNRRPICNLRKQLTKAFCSTGLRVRFL